MSKRSKEKSRGAEREHRSGFAALIGPANSGKSTLLNALIGEKVSIVTPKEQTTRNRILAVKTRDDGQIVLVDTPGFMSRKYRGELARYINDVLSDAADDVDLCVLVVDGARLLKDPRELPRLRSAVRQKRMSRLGIVAINKIDLFAQNRALALIAQLSELFAGWEGADGRPLEFVPISARRGTGLDELEQTIIKRLPPGPQYFPPEIVTDQPQQFMAAELIREKLMLRLAEEIPYSAAVHVEIWRKEKKMLHIGAVILLEKESHKPIVIGRGGAKLKAIGTAARRELEAALGLKVFLELFVRVEDKWTRSAKGLRRAGYMRSLAYPDFQ